MARLLTSIAAAVLALSVAPTFAASTATATLGPIQITLYDLNPTDEIAPSITFSDEMIEYYYGSYVNSSVYDSYRNLSAGDAAYGPGPFDPASVTSSLATATATGSVTGDGTALGTTLSASGTALGTTNPDASAGHYSSFYASANAPYYYYASAFTLSAGTAVVITVPSLLSATVTNTFDPSVYGYESAYASVGISMEGTGASGSGYQNASDSRSIGTGSQYVNDESRPFGYYYTGSAVTESSNLGMSFVNVSTGDISGNLYLSAYASGTSYANAVPEPGSYALMLAGLAAVGFVARRRRP